MPGPQASRSVAIEYCPQSFYRGCISNQDLVGGLRPNQPCPSGNSANFYQLIGIPFSKKEMSIVC